MFECRLEKEFIDDLFVAGVGCWSFGCVAVLILDALHTRGHMG
jgi:hypothetical protein